MLVEFRAEQASEDFPPFRPKGYVGGDDAFIAIMERNIIEGDEISLAADLTDPRLWDEVSLRRGKKRMIEYHDPFDVQAHRFAITDFNTWYVRGLTRRLLDEGIRTCEVFRAEAAYQPRLECRRLEGIELQTQTVYEGHRVKYHHPNADRRGLAVPFGPNCHHSIRRVTPGSD